MRFHPFVSPRWPASEHTAAAYFHAHRASPLLKPSVAGATELPATRARLGGSIHVPSIPPPSPACTAPTPWQSPGRWWPSVWRDPNQVTTPIGHRFSVDQTSTVLDRKS